MVNVELAKKVLDQITNHPETHDQGTYESISDCGTTRCIAGWTLAFSGYTLKDLGDLSYLNRVAVDRAGCPTEIQDTARRLLDISKSRASFLFYEANKSEAVAILRGMTFE